IYVVVCRTGTPVSSSAFNAGSGFTLGTTQYQDGCATEFGVDTNTGSITPTMTLGGASTYIEYIVAFKAAASPGAGTAPSGMYLQRLESWSTLGPTSASYTFQLPSTGNMLVDSNAGANPYQVTSITDSTNTWTQLGTNTAAYAYLSEYYVPNAMSNQTAAITLNSNGSSGDVTAKLYDFAGAVATFPFVGRAEYGYNYDTADGTLPISSTYLIGNGTGIPNATQAVVVSTGGQEFNTSIGMSTSGCIPDQGTYGAELISSPSIIDQNQPWGHCYYTAPPGLFSETFTESLSTLAPDDFAVDTVSFLTPAGIGIINSTTNQGTSGSTLALTVPSTSTNNLLVVSTGFWDNSTVRTVSKVCTDGATCAANHSFTQLTSAASTDTSSIPGTDIWYCTNCTSGVTTVTITYSGAIVNSEGMYWEVEKGSGGTWAADGSGAHQNATAVAGGSATGAAVNPTGTQDFCAAHVDITTHISANPAAGNAFIYANSGSGFSSGGGATSLLTQSSSAQTPVWSASSGTFNSSTGCFK